MWHTVAGGVIVVVTLVLMTTGRVRPVIALGCALVVAGILRIAPASALFGGLSNGGVITVGAMLVIAKGVVQTGVVARITRRLLATVHTAQQALRRLAAPVGVASALMNTTPIVAMLIPATKSLEQTRNIPARQVMLPIAHITTLTGSVTLIGTSSNLLIAGIAAGSGVSMSMLSFAPVALPTAVVGAVVIYVAARLLRTPVAGAEVVLDWRVEIPVAAGARIIGRTPGDVALATARDYAVVNVRRDGDYLPPDVAIAAGDRLVFQATEAGVKALWGSPLLGLKPHRLYAVSIRSGDENGFLADLEEDGTIQVVAAQTTVSLRRTSMLPGSTCYLAAADPDVLRGVEAIALWQDAASRAPQPRKTWIALSILAAVVITASIGLVPVEFGSVGGALLMVLTGVLTPRSAGRALDWNILFVLAGSVGLGAIVLSSGLADLLAAGIRTLSAGSALLVVLVFALITTVLTNLVTNAAAASILTPVALSLATELGVNPATLLALIGTCISFTFITPFSHQSNLMVMGPMGYTTKEFVRFGVPVLIAALITATVVATLLK
ncbi:SLC13 family permease [Microlunatus ginsengisoli]|uniref:Citrate transporter-like domain-containing protein n=1 Tax=Microlunatus ginsengisoli TaxID=363863 RepID=A0ABP6ZM53_9ACTN